VLDGISLKELINDKEVGRRAKPIGFRSRFRGQQWSVWNDNRYKLIHKEKEDEYLLFDLYKDPYEKKNIAAKHPEMVEKMKKGLQQWVSSVESENP
jgi:arylsulfatase A-like enzyme